MNKVVNSIILVDTAVNKITVTTTGGSMHGILIILWATAEGIEELTEN